MQGNRIIREIYRYSASFAVLIGIWELLSRFLHIPDYLLPHFNQVIETAIVDYAVLWDATCYTVRNAITGATFGCGLGFLFAVFLASCRPARWILEPYLTILQSFPRESLLPLLVTWIGFEAALKITSSTLLCFFPTALFLLPSLRNVRKDYVSLLSGWGASQSQIMLHLRIPYAVPSLIGAIRLAIPLSLIGSVLGEFMGGNRGLGHIILSSGASFRTDRVFGGILTLCLVGLMGTIIVNVFNAVFLHKYYEEK